MREFTAEEKELIVNTLITQKCFDMDNFSELQELCGVGYYVLNNWESLCLDFEKIRQKYLETKDERYFTELVRLLPNSYKVVKL